MRTARDGTELHLHAHPLDGARATIAVVHGYGEHGGRYDHVAAAWRERGLQSFAIDVRGHGRSRGPRGFVERFTDYHADLDVLLDVAREAARGGPLFLFGHSNGALIALHYLIARGGEGLRGLMLSSPFLAVALPVPKPKVMLGKVASRLVPGLALPAGLEGRHVTRGSTTPIRSTTRTRPRAGSPRPRPRPTWSWSARAPSRCPRSCSTAAPIRSSTPRARTCSRRSSR
jgi:alpha-beta hydrolase superfamily lysophospholipase